MRVLATHDVCLWCQYLYRARAFSTGTNSFPGQHTSESIERKLLEVRVDFGVHPRVSETHRLPEDEMRDCSEFAFQYEPVLDRPSLTTDYGSNIVAAAERGGANSTGRHVCATY